MSVDPARLTRVDAADVYKAGVLAGELRRSPSGTVFRYHPDYLDGPGPDVATSLPRSEVPVSFPGGAVPAFFAGLLPEGRRLTALRSAVKTSADGRFLLRDVPPGKVTLFAWGSLGGVPMRHEQDACHTPMVALRTNASRRSSSRITSSKVRRMS